MYFKYICSQRHKFLITSELIKIRFILSMFSLIPYLILIFKIPYKWFICKYTLTFLLYSLRSL